MKGRPFNWIENRANRASVGVVSQCLVAETQSEPQINHVCSPKSPNFVKKVTKMRIPAACVLKLLSDGKRTSWSGKDERVWQKVQTRACRFCLTTIYMVLASFSRASRLDRSDTTLKIGLIAEIRDLKH